MDPIRRDEMPEGETVQAAKIAATASVQAARIAAGGAVDAANAVRAGTLRAARLSGLTAVIAAAIAGVCGLAGAGVGGYLGAQASLQHEVAAVNECGAWVEYGDGRWIWAKYLDNPRIIVYC